MEIAFIRYAQSRHVRKQIFFFKKLWSKKAKGTKYDSKNWPMLPLYVRERTTLFEMTIILFRNRKFN